MAATVRASHWRRHASVQVGSGLALQRSHRQPMLAQIWSIRT